VIGCGGAPHDRGADFHAARSPAEPTATIATRPQPDAATAFVKCATNAPCSVTTIAFERCVESVLTETTTRSPALNPVPATVVGEAAIKRTRGPAAPQAAGTIAAASSAAIMTRMAP